MPHLTRRRRVTEVHGVKAVKITTLKLQMRVMGLLGLTGKLWRYRNHRKGVEIQDSDGWCNIVERGAHEEGAMAVQG